MLCPIPEIYNDAAKNMNGEHRDAIDRLLKKKYACELADDSEELATLMNTFWDEFEHFRSKTQHFEKQYIWSATNRDLSSGNSYMWHKKKGNSQYHK